MKFRKEQPKIIIVGSCSLDLILRVDSHPQIGETIIASKSENYYGGKGANQAVAISRLGGQSYLVSSVGMDPMGQQILRSLIKEGVNVGFVSECEDLPTGTAYVSSTLEGNSIIVVPAANSRLSPKHISQSEKFFEAADMILTQLEIPMETVIATYEMAKKHQVKLGIYAAPAQKLPQEIIEYAHFIVAKKEDASIVFGKDIDDILTQWPKKLFLRAENNSTIYHNGDAVITHLPPLSPLPHKMGMGEGFTSGFAFAFYHNNSVEDAIELGSEIAMRVAQEKGSQKGLPFLSDLDFQ